MLQYSLTSLWIYLNCSFLHVLPSPFTPSHTVINMAEHITLWELGVWSPPGFTSWLHYLPAVWPWKSYLTSLSTCFFICKMRIRMFPYHTGAASMPLFFTASVHTQRECPATWFPTVLSCQCHCSDSGSVRSWRAFLCVTGLMGMPSWRGSSQCFGLKCFLLAP